MSPTLVPLRVYEDELVKIPSWNPILRLKFNASFIGINRKVIMIILNINLEQNSSS